MQHLKRRMARTRLERDAARRARRLRSRLATDIRCAREDAGLSLGRVADAAGVSKSHLHAIEAGDSEPSFEVLARVGEALGMDLSVRFYPGTGPLLRDHIQAAMIEATLEILYPRWRPTPEVWVARPVKGVIDLVLEPDDETEPLVATEAQSELRRLEQQVRWAQAKAEALAQARERVTSTLLLLRNTRNSRALVAEHARTLRAAYPATAGEAYDALTGTNPWPGATLLWCDVQDGRARIRHVPPRGTTVGR